MGDIKNWFLCSQHKWKFWKTTLPPFSACYSFCSQCSQLICLAYSVQYISVSGVLSLILHCTLTTMHTFCTRWGFDITFFAATGVIPSFYFRAHVLHFIQTKSLQDTECFFNFIFTNVNSSGRKEAWAVIKLSKVAKLHHHLIWIACM